MLKLNYFLADIFILSAEKQPIKLSWRKIECLHVNDLSPSFISEFKKQVSNSPAIKFIIAPKYDDFENIVPTPIIIDNNL